ncbi:DNA N(6)-methyladenine demethylase ALKBH1D-like [Rutidosis leptorrhynchoides]|uniref:DNA N(6)-methyladenine demethylase ALKBH1D-like n=1 Tax=Rutidosis leptorrhynchoides TaxID=125765 RepID=UPI003A98D611
MSGHSRQGNRSFSGKSDSKIKKTNAEWKTKPKIVSEGSFGSASSSQNDSLSVSEEFMVNDLPSVVKNLKLYDNDDCNSKNCEKIVGNTCGKDDGDQDLGDKDNGSNKMRFDICPKRATVKLKAPLHVLNKEKRNQSKRDKPNVFLRPGMVLLKKYISIDDQISIVKTCRQLGVSDGGFYQPGYRGGTKLHLKMMCLGKNWDPETKLYSETRPIDDAKPPAIPQVFHDMVKKAIEDSNAHIRNEVPEANAGALVPLMDPDLCIVNFYSKSGKLGLHQDKDESEISLKKGLPVVSFSIGDSAEFLYGDTRNPDDAKEVILESGDVLIFGGKSRHIFHGVTYILPDTAPTSLIEATDMLPGRLNLTFRRY